MRTKYWESPGVRKLLDEELKARHKNELPTNYTVQVINIGTSFIELSLMNMSDTSEKQLQISGTVFLSVVQLDLRPLIPVARATQFEIDDDVIEYVMLLTTEEATANALPSLAYVATVPGSSSSSSTSTAQV